MLVGFQVPHGFDAFWESSWCVMVLALKPHVDYGLKLGLIVLVIDSICMVYALLWLYRFFRISMDISLVAGGLVAVGLSAYAARWAIY